MRISNDPPWENTARRFALILQIKRPSNEVRLYFFFLYLYLFIFMVSVVLIRTKENGRLACTHDLRADMY